VDPEQEPTERDSSMRIEFVLSIGYVRKRAQLSDRFEARLGTLALILVGALVVVIVLLTILPRVLEAIGRL